MAIHGGVGETETDRGAADDADFLVATGTATAIGSLPLSDADEAVELVLSALPRLPAAPSLPVPPGPAPSVWAKAGKHSSMLRNTKTRCSKWFMGALWR